MQCLFCADGAPETLTHFACLCPKFREARTSAHKQLRQTIISFLRQMVGPNWIVSEEARMGQLGLTLRPVPASRVSHALSWSPEQGWVAHAFKFPLVVDVRGMINPGPLCTLLQFLEKPKKLWLPAIERRVLASVRAFYFLHLIRFGCRKGADLPELRSSEQGSEVTKRYIATR